MFFIGFIYKDLFSNICAQSFDAKRTWFYFPMFSFLEQNVDGRVPNVFELPVSPQDLTLLAARAAAGIRNRFHEFQQVKERLNTKREKKKGKNS